MAHLATVEALAAAARRPATVIAAVLIATPIAAEASPALVLYTVSMKLLSSSVVLDVQSTVGPALLFVYSPRPSSRSSPTEQRAPFKPYRVRVRREW